MENQDAENLDDISYHSQTLTHHLNNNISFSSLNITRSDLPIKSLVLMAHGYTAYKAQMQNWAFRLLDLGCACSIIDLPGHRLGHFFDVSNFEDFKKQSSLIFPKVLQDLTQSLKLDPNQLQKIFFSGHSLGGFLALKGFESLESNLHSKMHYICVGLGTNLANEKQNHFLENSFFAKTLKFRNALVSECLHSDKVFAWLKDAKTQLKINQSKIHLITGENDLIAPPAQIENLASILRPHNQVEITIQKQLSHHEPEKASPIVYQVIKSVL